MPKFRFSEIAFNSTAKKKPTEEDKYTYIGLEHLDSGNLTVSRWGSDVAPVGEKLLMKKGDVLFGKRRAYQKKVAISPFDGIFSAHGMVLRPNEKIVTKEYFPLFISSDYFLDEAIRISVGSLSPTVNWKDLKDIEFDLPTIEEQERLTPIIWAAIEAKNAYKKQLDCIDDLVKSQFIEMFETSDLHFSECTIAEACSTKDDIKCGPFGTQLKQADYKNSGVAIWGIPQINAEFTIDPDAYVTSEKAKQLDSYSLIPGDIAMSRKGNVGQCAIYPNEFPDGIIASDVLRIRIDKERLTPQFMQYQLHHSNYVRQQILNVSNGAVMAGINVTKLKNIKVYIPPLTLQNQFSDFVKQADKSKFATQPCTLQHLMDAVIGQEA